ncbi:MULTISPECIES: multiple monosaccharide ABC transporter ATP-binding protein [Bradyrhizobium]|jgi:putative multiple sugar transport system ATP-binding protein|uniref:Multiple monosaccharide ABC transporter ATP-binding protein n=2 Tax=Bradyrhizobium TaxID=374 RepID=A0ABY0PHQ7_9BRAD|nr:MULTISPECIES: multiple monosaccharide ABC transporter ATP-binding protein [Bradyrhizobium]SDI40570.1 multiple monosaccharide ABC transporter ATP-binding protein [Bradyrhizobium ottawaense]SED56400.1 multiple monosaccharide ABC transporter ATP-binding protein [Bradyrhizobium lablabi]SHL55266.1 multiple monosaccharide ABC transporter ATP-binding protein [Bradyrhizobium lablabi]
MTAILEMRGISKSFPGVKALRNVNLRVEAGEIHAICGENGAGKSTLMKILSGVYPHGAYEGDIFYDGEKRQFADISDSERLGIIIIHQELALVPLLSIAENIFLGHEPATMGVIDWDEAFRRTRELLAKVGLNEAPDTLITHLGVGKQQLVEIAKALAKKVRLLILDEPTASLNDSDSEALLELLKEFRSQGIASILISHKLNELAEVADSITVMRDGTTVETIDARTEEISEARIIKSMVGRELSERYPHREPRIGDTLFEIRDWRVEHPLHAGREVIKGVSLRVRQGEVVGIAGLMGAGRTELAMSVFGRAYGRNVTGQAFMQGREIDLSSIQKAVAGGVAYLTEDRKGLGLVLGEDIKSNITLANLAGVAWHGVIDDDRETDVAEQYRSKLNIRSSGILQKALNLSGGNQQKVVLSKWLFADPKVLILDEPTRGIDIGAKYEIYTIINDLAASGKAVIVISSEMPELLGICDRLYVMNEGRLIDEMPVREASQEKIMAAIMRQHGTAP